MADERPDDEPAPTGGLAELASSATSGWSFNWIGLVPVALLLIAAIVVSKRIGGDSRDTAVTAAPTITAAATTTVATPAQSAAPTTIPATTTPPTTSPTPLPERRVIISGEMKPCRFGANCLAASFRIEGFQTHPGRFACIYPNSQREFEFNDDDVVDACLTADPGDTISIEVGGVRSAEISERNLDGAPPPTTP